MGLHTLLSRDHSATASVLELRPAALRSELAYRALRVSDSSPLAGSGSPSKNFFSWQRGYAATWEQRTFAPFGRYTAARQMTNGSTIIVPAMSQSFGHSGASCFVIRLPSHPERQPSPSSRRVHPLKCRWRCRRRCDSQATQR